MLLQEKIVIKPCNAHLSRYSAMGYDVKKKLDKKGRERMVLGQCIEVSVFDLPKTSSEEVLCSCDYCGKEYYEKWKNVKAVVLNEQSVNKMACSDCKHIKSCEVAYLREEKAKKIKNTSYRDKEWLFCEYVDKGRSAEDIAEECGIDVRNIREYISKFGLCVKIVDYHSKITKSVLYEEYINNKKTFNVIAREYNLKPQNVIKLLTEYEIPIRSRAESMRIYYDERGGREVKRQKSLEMWSDENFHQKMCEINKVNSQKIEHRIKQSAALQHISVDEWNGFVTSENKRLRNSFEYDNWRNAVFKRDDYTCQCCGRRSRVGDSVTLHAHHLENFALNSDLRFDIDNGVTLCYECHDVRVDGSFHNMYGTIGNTKEQYEEYILQSQRGD